MSRHVIGQEIEAVIQTLARLPGLGPRSARRACLHLIKHRETLLEPLAQALRLASDQVEVCRSCGNIDSRNPCGLCADTRRDHGVICAVEDIGDLWALERAHVLNCGYHVIGGVLSAIEGVGMEDLNIAGLIARVATGQVREVILALNATVDGQTTAYVIAGELRAVAPRLVVSRLAHGVPVGGELDYLDDGTLAAALTARKPVDDPNFP